MYEELIETLRKARIKTGQVFACPEVDPAENAYLERVQMRLTAYEATGMEPDDIESLKIIPATNELLAYRALGTVDELTALVKAQDEGRVVVLPCKVGSTVYLISKCQAVQMSRDDDYFTGTGAVECPFESDCDTENCHDEHIRIFETILTGFWYGEENEKRPEMFFEHIGGGYRLSDFGKTVFLTRAEAEAAQREKGQDKPNCHTCGHDCAGIEDGPCRDYAPAPSGAQDTTTR